MTLFAFHETVCKGCQLIIPYSLGKLIRIHMLTRVLRNEITILIIRNVICHLLKLLINTFEPVNEFLAIQESVLSPPLGSIQEYVDLRVRKRSLHLSSFRHPRKPVLHSTLERNVASTLTIAANVS